jgi:lipoprotein-releasing system permease protein
MAKCGDNVVGLQLKGVGPTYNTEWWQSRLVEGSLPDFGAEQRGRQMLLSRATASLLGIGVGDRVEMLFVEDNRPRRDAFRVVGLYHTGFEEMDRVVALCDERDVRREVAIADDRVSGYDVAIADGYQMDDVAAALDEEIFLQAGQDEGFVSTLAATLRMRHPVIFDWMQAHTVIARAVIIIMMVVLLFNMAAAMLIMVFDRIGMIGVLKAQGMRNAAIRKVFLYRAAMLFMKGAAWGNVVGLTFVAVQAVWHPIKLDPDGYMLSHLPVGWELWWWALLNVAALAATVVVMVLPSAMVARIKPEQSLKYKL